MGENRTLREALRDSGAVRGALQSGPAVIGLQGIVNGKRAAHRKGILEEGELPRHVPENRGQRQPGRAAELRVVEVAHLIVDEGSGDPLVRVVAPGRRVRRGPAKHARCQPLREFVAEVPAVNRAQARRVGQEEASDPHGDHRIRILVIQAQMIRPVHQVVQRQGGSSARAARALRIQQAPPVARQIPMRAPDAAHVGLHQQPDLPRAEAARFGQSAKIKSESPA